MKILNKLILSKKLHKIERNIKLRTELLSINFLDEMNFANSYDFDDILSDFVNNIHEIYTEELMKEMEED